MERHGDLIQLRPEWRERYIILHKHAFPEVIAQIKRSHIGNYSIFLYRNVLFGYYEYTGSDYTADMAVMAADETTREWWKLTDSAQLPMPSAAEGEWWTAAGEVFHFGGSTMPAQKTERHARMVGLKPECEAEYRDIHNAVWPGVLAQVERSHIRNYSIFLRDSVLYAYFEYTGEDFDADMAAMADDAETQRWWEITTPMMRMLPGVPKGGLWADMDEVFRME